MTATNPVLGLCTNWSLRTRRSESSRASHGWVLASVALVAWGCSSEPARHVDYEPAVAAPSAALTLGDTTSCNSDAECEAGVGCFQGRCVVECYDATDCASGQVCNDRGRCAMSSTPDVPVAPQTAGTATGRAGNTNFRVLPGQQTVVLHIDITGTPPSGPFAYSLDRSDNPASSRDLFRVASAASVDLPIATGLANPDNGDRATAVEMTVYTPVGRFPVQLAPAFPSSGKYAGNARLTGLGARGVPFAFHIVTDPPGAALPDATSAWAVLEVSNASFFSPHDDFAGAPTQIAAPLAFEALVNGWVAKFEYAFNTSSNAEFPTFVHLPAGQVGRSIRLEIVEAANGQVQGNLVDRWVGLSETVNAVGVIVPRELTFVGPFDGRRVADALTVAEVAALPATTATAATPSTIAMPDIAASCPASIVLPTTSQLIDEGGTLTAYDCVGVTLANFASQPVGVRARCAVALARASLGATTLSSTLADYLNPTVTPQNSFASFLADCANPVMTVCTPSPEILCARTLLANASRNLPSVALESNVLSAFQDATREATLGPQLAAYKRDSDSRFAWLQSSNVPPFVAAALENQNHDLLQTWADDVLATHFAVLARHLDHASLSTQALEPANQLLREQRQKGLLEASQAWRAAADATLFLAQRLNGNTRLSTDRTTWANYLRPRARYLYVTAGLIQAMQADVGGGAQAAGFGGVFGQVTTQIGLLNGSFNNLLFARDADVVVSTSLDPTVGNAQILGARQAAAIAAVDTAKANIDALIATIQSDTLSRTLLDGQYATAISDTQNRIIDLCGLPQNCTAAQYRNGVSSCQIQTTQGLCGFVIDGLTRQTVNFQAGSQSVSQAGRAVLDVIAARNQLQIASAARSADIAASNIELDNLEAFAAEVQRWNGVRQAGLQEMSLIFSEQTRLQNASLQTMVSNFATVAATRAASIEGDRATLMEWDAMRSATTTTTFAAMKEAINSRTTAEGLRLAASGVDRVADAVVEAFPLQVGTSNDVFSAARAAALFASMGVSIGLQGGAIALDASANERDLDAQRTQAISDATLESLMASADIDSAVTDAEIEALYNAVQSAQGESRAAIDALARGADLAREQREVELAFARDLTALNDRRAHYRTTLLNASRLELEQNQAELNVQQALSDYAVLVQQAELANESLALLQAQRSQVSNIIGSPAAVFAGARRLEAADVELQQARDALMEWLVAMEYFAVRPFVDMRIRIVLARNADQLKVVATELSRLQSKCGGPTNSATVDASLRTDLIRMSDDLIDPATGLVVPAAERFQSMLHRGAVPVDRRVRYSTDSTIGTLLSENRGILSASFNLPLDDFANLAQTCNGKVLSIEAQLRGDLGTTTATPTVTILYDGMSTMRSCQTDLASYVSNFGINPDTGRPLTNYGSVTQFNTPGRSATLVANRCSTSAPGECGASWSGNNNGTFAGLPIASQYTVFIDPTVGRNSEFDWTRLEDIVLRINYSFQDPFPYAGTECVEQ